MQEDMLVLCPAFTLPSFPSVPLVRNVLTELVLTLYRSTGQLPTINAAGQPEHESKQFIL